MTQTKEKTAKSEGVDFTEGLEHAQKIDKECTSAARRFTDMMSESISTWEEKREEFVSKAKSGSAEDHFKDAHEKFHSALKESIDAHSNFMKSLHGIAEKHTPSA